MPATFTPSRGSSGGAGPADAVLAPAPEGSRKQRRIAEEDDPKVRQSAKGKQLKNYNGGSVKAIAPMHTLLVKALLQAHQKVRDLAGAVFDTYILDAGAPEVLEMGLQTAEYSEQVRTKGRGHGLGPPFYYAFGGLLKALISKRGDLIGNSSKAMIEKYYNIMDGTDDFEEKAEIIQFCKLDKMYQEGKKRLTVSIRETELRKAISRALLECGADRRYGRAPPTFMERELQQWVETLTAEKKE